MQKITLIVPDSITRKTGESRTDSHYSEIRVSPRNLLMVLTHSGDFHDDFYFPDPKDVRIIKIEKL